MVWPCRNCGLRDLFIVFLSYELCERVPLHKLSSEVSLSSEEPRAHRHTPEIRGEKRLKAIAPSRAVFISFSVFSGCISLTLHPHNHISLEQHETVYSVYLSILLFYDTNVNCFYREKACFDSAVIISLWVSVGGGSDCGSEESLSTASDGKIQKRNINSFTMSCPSVQCANTLHKHRQDSCAALRRLFWPNKDIV